MVDRELDWSGTFGIPNLAVGNCWWHNGGLEREAILGGDGHEGS